jgi:hypothetical protein
VCYKPRMTFVDLFSRYAASSFARQLALADLLGEHDWNLTLSTGLAEFGDGLKFSAQLVGTESDGDSSWLWAWANRQSDIPESLLVRANEARQKLEDVNVPFLRERSFPLSGGVTAHQIAMICSGLAGDLAYYRGPYDGGALYFMLEGCPESVLGNFAPQRIATVFNELICMFDVNHKLMVESFFLQQGMPVKISGSIWTAGSSNEVVVKFNEAGLIAEVSASVRA